MQPRHNRIRERTSDMILGYTLLALSVAFPVISAIAVAKGWVK